MRETWKYQINKSKVENGKVVDFMLYTVMCVDNSGYYAFSELSSIKYFFPFDYKIEKKQLLDDSRFVLNNFGGELTVGIKE